MLGHDFHVTSIFCLHCALNQFTKFARGSSLIMEKNFAQGKIKSGRKSMVKKKEKKRKKKKQAQRRK